MANNLQRLLLAKSKGDNWLARFLLGKGRVPIQLWPLEGSSSNIDGRGNVCDLILGLRHASTYTHVLGCPGLPRARGEQFRRHSAAVNGACKIGS